MVGYIDSEMVALHLKGMLFQKVIIFKNQPAPAARLMSLSMQGFQMAEHQKENREI